MTKIITFLFPHPALEPAGGYKMVYEYANRLVADRYNVNIIYAGSIFWSKKSLYHKMTNCIRYVQNYFRGYSCKIWFSLDKRVKERFVFSLNYRYIPKSDIYVCTTPFTAMYLKDYPITNNCRYYFIQGYENWGGVTDVQLWETYRYSLHKIVVSSWLKRLMEEENVSCDVVLNGFDFKSFHLTVPIYEKDKYRVVMVYSPIENKGCKYGFEALKRVKQVYPQLQVTLFGSTEKPSDLPEWFDYYQCPDKELHNRIYNEAAIFLATSIQEGWGLPIGEAMICGQAVVCTDNLGYKEMAIDKENALLCPIRDSKALATSIIKLIKDDELRYRIAEKGHMHIQKFGLDDSYVKLKEVLGLL